MIHLECLGGPLDGARVPAPTDTLGWHVRINRRYEYIVTANGDYTRQLVLSYVGEVTAKAPE